MCKCCQNCLESLWWNCCEERFCWDDSIVLYEEDEYWNHKNGGVDNMGASFESLVVTRQPSHMQNNNHLQDQMYTGSRRDVLQELPILAPNLYQVFSKSMIFRDDSKDFSNFIDENDPTGPNFNKNKEHLGKNVTFNDGVTENDTNEQIEEKHISDFQIMFQDELYGKTEMFNIEEEDEDDIAKTPVLEEPEVVDDDVQEEVVLRRDVKSIAPIDIVLNEIVPERAKDPVTSSPTMIREGRNMRKQLLRAKSAYYLPRSDSARSFFRSNSRQDLLRRVESMKENETENLKNVLAKLPEKSISFITVPNLIDGKETSMKKEEIFTIAQNEDFGRHSLISKMPDTPVIKGGKFPKFFVETPTIGEYKPETSLQSLKTSDIIASEFDFSMPRYYGYKFAPKSPEPLHASKSLPDLNVDNRGKVNKRLVKLRGRLKPLVIKKSEADFSKPHSDPHKF